MPLFTLGLDYRTVHLGESGNSGHCIPSPIENLQWEVRGTKLFQYNTLYFTETFGRVRSGRRLSIGRGELG